MSTGTIVSIKPGHRMDPEFRVKLLEENPNSFSFASSDKKNVEHKLVNSNEFELLGSLTALEDGFKDRLVVVRAANEDVVDGEEQPFELIIDKEGKPLLVAFVEGDFTKYASDTATLSPEATFVSDWLADHVNGMYSSCNGDMNKLMILLDTPSFQEAAREHMEPRGVVVFFSKDGKAVYVAKSNSQYGKFDWGETSKTHGILAAKPAETVPAGTDLSTLTYSERKALQKAGKKEGPIIKIEPLANPEIKEKEEQPTINMPQTQGIKDQEYANGAIKRIGQGHPMLFPPSNLVGRDLKKWYGRHRKFGTQGLDHNQRPGIPASEVAKNSHFFLVLNPPAQQADPKPKDVEVHNQPDPQVVSKPVPIMPPDQVVKDIATLKKFEAASAEELDKSLEKYGTFSSRMERSLDELLLAPFEAYYELGQNGVKGLACLANEFRLRILADHPEIMAKARKPVVTPPVEKDISEMSYSERKALQKKQKAA